MKRIIPASAIALFALASLPAFGQITLTDFENFSSPTASGTVLLRHPSFSGSTSSKIDQSAGNTTQVQFANLPAGNAASGTNALLTTINFIDTATPFWARMTTSGTANLGNPTIGLYQGWGLKFDVYSDTPLYVSLLIRETESNLALGANGGGTGAIEFVGGVPSAATGNRGKAVPANTWTTLQFNWTGDQVAGFAGASDGAITPGTDGKGVLEAIGIATDAANTGTMQIWIDNIQMVPEPSTFALAGMGVAALLIFRRRN